MIIINKELTSCSLAGGCIRQFEEFDGNNIHVPKQKKRTLPNNDNMHTPLLSEYSHCLITVKDVFFLYAKEHSTEAQDELDHGTNWIAACVEKPF